MTPFSSKPALIHSCVFLGTGPVTYRSAHERLAFVSDVDRLRAFGPLNPDCPELAFTGMLNALKEGPAYISPMFVFTDASAKDADSLNKEELKAMAKAAKVTITFFIDLEGCTSGMKDYEEIAKDTGGRRTSCLKLFLERTSG